LTSAAWTLLLIATAQLCPSAGVCLQQVGLFPTYAWLRSFELDQKTVLHVLQVVMLFPRPFWPVDADMFGRVGETTADRGEFFLFYSYTHVCGCGSFQK